MPEKLSNEPEYEAQLSLFDGTDDSQENIAEVTENTSVVIYQKAISTTTSLSINAQRLLRTIIGLIGPDDKENKPYTFLVRDFQKIYGLKTNPSKQLIKAAMELGQRIYIPDPENPERDGEVTGWIDKLKIKNGIATVRFQPELLAVYQSIKEYTYNLGNTKEFQLSYTFSLYEKFIAELGKSNGVTFYMSLHEVRKWLKLEDKYVTVEGDFDYANFKRRILKKVIDDINNGGQENNPCNIKINVEERKIGRKVVGIEFSIWRVHEDTFEVKVTNPFYDNLHPTTKKYYDAALKGNIDASEIEKSIIRYGDEIFAKIMEYIIKDNKDKNVAYWTACIRNGWFDKSSQNRFNFQNLTNTVRFYDDIYGSCCRFFKSLPPKKQKPVLLQVAKELKSGRPQIYEYLTTNPVENIVNNEGVMLFVAEVLKSMIDSNKNNDIVKEYNEWKDTPVEESTNSIRIGREAIIAELNKENIYNFDVIDKILENDDEYIMANIKYCRDKYRASGKQQDIAGSIIASMQKDYANFKAKKKEHDKKQRKTMAILEFKKNKDSYSDAELQSKIKTAKDNPELLELIDAEISSRQAKKRKEELKEYFFNLDFIEQAEIISEMKKSGGVLANAVKAKSPEELWNNPMLVAALLNATEKFKEQQE